MRPTEIPEAEIWPGAELAEFGPPPGMTGVAPVAALVDTGQDTGLPRACVRLELDPGDLATLQAGGVVWLSFYGGMVPWCVDVRLPGEGGATGAATGG